MFLYQTKDIYDKSGNGPLKGLVIKTTPNGCKDMVPAVAGQTVMFLEESEAKITFNEEFEVGEKSEEEEEDVDTPEALVDALENAEDGAVIKLTADMAMEQTVAVSGEKAVTIDLGGKEMSGNATVLSVTDGAELTLKNGTVKATAGDGAVVTAGGKLVVEGATIVSEHGNGISAKEGEVVFEEGTITSQEAGILGLKNAVVTVNGGEIEGLDNGPIMGNGSKAGSKNDGTNANFVMNGGKLIAHIQSSGYIACGVYIPNSGSFTMNGGEIVSDGCGICMRGGTVNLNGGSIEANGATGFKGKVGDSRVVVGPYAVVYDVNSKYPAYETLELNIANGMVLTGTDGDIDVVPEEERDNANIHDNRE